jgi:hypothetical protein
MDQETTEGDTALACYLFDRLQMQIIGGCLRCRQRATGHRAAAPATPTRAPPASASSGASARSRAEQAIMIFVSHQFLRRDAAARSAGATPVDLT